MPTGWWKSRDSSNANALGGRWYLLPPPLPTTSPTDLAEAAADRAQRLLNRNAFACRELLEPALDGPWRDCYDVLTRMEWAGSVRRGYFVEGITGSQFSLPNINLQNPVGGGNLAHSPKHSALVWISMLDPANLWAKLNTRWLADSGDPARIPRSPGSYIALLNGRPVLAATSYAQRLIPLPADPADHELALRALPSLLPRLPKPRHPHLEIQSWNTTDILQSPAAQILLSLGFQRTTTALRLYRQYTTTP
jgi:ATP-dependent Lhr-like helicase